MCFNSYTSLISLLIGLIFCFLLWNEKGNSVKIISVLWTFVLLMQLFEWLIWLNQHSNKSIQLFLTKCTMIANLLQPIVVVFLCVHFLPSTYNLYLLGSLLFYISFMFIKLYYIRDPITYLTPSGSCKHLQYDWWKNTSWEVLFYLIPIIASILCCMRPLSLAIFESAYILLTLFVSIIIYSCGIPSLWCWMAAFASLFTYIFVKII